eukprot:scaffold114123_cov48-Phaeocystis_antarctica.AAC.1
MPPLPQAVRVPGPRVRRIPHSLVPLRWRAAAFRHGSRAPLRARRRRLCARSRLGHSSGQAAHQRPLSCGRGLGDELCAQEEHRPRQQQAVELRRPWPKRHRRPGEIRTMPRTPLAPEPERELEPKHRTPNTEHRTPNTDVEPKPKPESQPEPKPRPPPDQVELTQMQKHKKYGHVGVSGSGLPKAGETTACTAASTSTKGATKPAAKAAAAKAAAATSVAKRAAKRTAPATPATPKAAKAAKAAKPSPSPSPAVATTATAVAVAPAKPAAGKSVGGKSAATKPTRKRAPAPSAAAPPAAAPPAALLERHRKLELRIQKLVAKGEAEIEPEGAELSVEALVVDALVWGEYRGDK